MVRNMSTDEASNRESTCNGTESRCALCHERLKGRHTHPELWACDLQQFLLRYTAIPLGSCVCRADQVSIKKGLGLAGKHKDEFIPRWIKRELQQQKSSCCVPGCGMVAECTCVFASFDTICAAISVNTDESATVADTNSFPLCVQHYHIVYKHCNRESVVECALCGSKRKHRASSNLRWTFRPVPQPESVAVLLQETGNFDQCITGDSFACNKCYAFCQRLLQQCDEDLRPPEAIVHALRTKVDELQDSFRQCSNITDHNEVALLHTTISLGEHMLSDQAITFPQLYQKYCEYLQCRLTGNVPPLPRYQVFVYMGKEFGDLMSSVSARNRLGRVLYRAKCDPFLMLSHALGNAKAQYEKEGTMIPPVEPVADYLNEMVHDLATQLMAKHEKDPVSANIFDLEAFASHVAPDLWNAVTRLTQSCNEKLGRKQSDSHLHERKVRVAYIVRVILFCATGGRCSVPLHTLLTDYIEACGGSSELITVLNRLGAVASIETLDRHIVRVSVQRKQHGLLKGLDDKSFTVATTDNIDFLQSHASVYSGSQH